jgi:CheY-like chemotaxis protein
MGRVVALVDDLMFLSRIREAAAGRELAPVRSVAALLDTCRAGASLIVMDLDSPRLPTTEALAALKADPDCTAITVVGFFSHAHVERARAAEAAGCSQVMPRSLFVKELLALLAQAYSA